MLNYKSHWIQDTWLIYSTSQLLSFITSNEELVAEIKNTVIQLTQNEMLTYKINKYVYNLICYK